MYMLTENQKRFAGILYSCPFFTHVSTCVIDKYRNNISSKSIEKQINKFQYFEIENILAEHTKCFIKRSEDMLFEKNRMQIEIMKKLTERQLQVIKLICNSHTNNDVAEKLNISPFTAANHRRNAYKQLGIRNIKELRCIVSKHDFF